MKRVYLIAATLQMGVAAALIVGSLWSKTWQVYTAGQATLAVAMLMIIRSDTDR